MKMTNEELLDALNKRFDAIDSRLEKIEEDLAELKEAHEATRDGVNVLLDWADNVAIEVKIPLKPAQ